MTLHHNCDPSTFEIDISISDEFYKSTIAMLETVLQHQSLVNKLRVLGMNILFVVSYCYYYIIMEKNFKSDILTSKIIYLKKKKKEKNITILGIMW